MPDLPRDRGIRTFMRALRPTWRGFLSVLLLCWGFEWLGFTLAWWPPEVYGAGSMLTVPTPFFPDAFLLSVGSAARAPWWAAMGAVAPLLAAGTSVALFRTAGGSVQRVFIGAAVAAAAVSGIGWAAFTSSAEPLPRDPFGPLLVPNLIIVFAAAPPSAWLLYRATGVSRTRVPFGDCAPALLLTAVLVLNVAILFMHPLSELSWVFRQPNWFDGLSLGTDFLQVSIWEYQIRQYTIPILGGILLLVPAWIATRGWGFRTCLRRLGTLARRRPGYLLTTYAGLILIAVVPIGEWLRAPLDSASWAQSRFPGSILAALCSGLETALFVYATALAANALAVSLGRDQHVSDLDGITLS